MSLESRRIGDLVITLQECFLAKPDLALSAWQAEQVCGADEMTCRAILRLLVDGGVIAKTADGRYIRHLPSLSRATARRSVRARRPLTLTRPALAG
jgi:hypothetical protein